MTLLEPKRPYQEVGFTLRKHLADGRYQLGERMPPEREIAEQLGVSRTIVREALIMLELEGLIEVRKGSGVYIIAFPTDSVSSAFIQNKSLNDNVGPFEILQARQLLESNIAEFAAMKATPQDIQAMKLALKTERNDLIYGVSEQGDMEFHLAIANATHNSMLIELFNQAWSWRNNNPMWQQLHSRIENTNYRQEWLEDHRGILNAMVRKDPLMAKKAMWQHLENVKQTLMALSDVEHPDFDGFLFESYPVVIN